jgi:hypothetical protein
LGFKGLKKGCTTENIYVFSDILQCYYHKARYEDITFGAKVLRVLENGMLWELCRPERDGNKVLEKNAKWGTL